MVVGRRYERIESVEYLRRSSSGLGGGYRVDRLLSDYPVEKELFNEGDQPSLFWRASLKTSFGTPTGPNGFDVGRSKLFLRPELLRLVKRGKTIKRRLISRLIVVRRKVERTGPNYHSLATEVEVTAGKTADKYGKDVLTSAKALAAGRKVQVTWMSRREIGHTVGVGKKSLDEIEEALQKHGMGWIPDGISLKQRDWKFLPVGALVLMGFLPKRIFPRGLDRKLELGQYLGFTDQQLVKMLDEDYRGRTFYPYAEILEEHRAFIEQVRLLVD